MSVRGVKLVKLPGLSIGADANELKLTDPVLQSAPASA